MNEIQLIYDKLKDIYSLTLTTTFALNEGYTIDVPVIRGAAFDARFDLYKEDDGNGLFVFSVELFDKVGEDKYTHGHPYDADDAVRWIEDFMSGRMKF